MNAKQRQKIAARLASIARNAGASVTIENEPRYRETRVEAHFPDISVSFDIGGCLQPGIISHWYGAKRDLQWSPVFDSVNDCHHRKATMYRDDPEWFEAAFMDACAAVASGEVFA